VVHMHKKMFLPNEVFFFKGAVDEAWMGVLVQGTAVMDLGGGISRVLPCGECFGALTVMGVSKERTATISARTVCDVRALHVKAFDSLLLRHPEEKARFQQMAAAHVMNDTVAKRQSMGVSDICRVALFEDCPTDFVEQLRSGFEPIQFLEGSVISRAGEEADWLGIVIQGTVRVESQGVVAREEITPQSASPCFGEINVLGLTEKRQRTLIAKTQVGILAIRKSEFAQAIAQFPAVRPGFQRYVAGWIERNRLDHGLNQLHFLRRAPQKFLDKLALVMTTKVFWPRQTIVTKGVATDAMVIFACGKCDIFTEGHIEKGQVGDSMLEAPTAVDTVAVLECAYTSLVTVKARSMVVVRLIHRAQFRHALNSVPEAAETVSMRRVRSKQAEATLKHSRRQSVGRLLANKTVDLSQRKRHHRETSQETLRGASEEAVNPWGIEVRKDSAGDAPFAGDAPASDAGGSVPSSPATEKRAPYTQRRTRAGGGADGPRRASALLSTPVDLLQSSPGAEDHRSSSSDSGSRSSTPPSSVTGGDFSDSDIDVDNPDTILSRRSSVVVVFSDGGQRTALSEVSDTLGDVLNVESRREVENRGVVQAPARITGAVARPSPRRPHASPRRAPRKILPPPPVHFRLGFFGSATTDGVSSMASTCTNPSSGAHSGMDQTMDLLPAVPCAVPWTWPPKPRGAGAAAVGARGRPRRKHAPVRKQDRVEAVAVDVFDF